MAFYQNSVFTPPTKTIKRMQTGVLPIYLFGDKDSHTTNTEFFVSQVQLTSDEATLTVALKGGGGGNPLAPPVVPVVGQNMGVIGTQTSSGLFNVPFTQVTATTVSAATGAGTISYSLTSGNVDATADSGLLVVAPYERPDLITGTVASVPVAQTFTPDDSDNARCLFAEAKWTGTLPTTATIVLQVANVDEDSRYITVDNSAGNTNLATVSGSAVTQQGAEYSFIMGKFIRAQITAFTGGDDTTGLVLTLFA